ncbi:MAG: hypothetical protein JNL88_09385 [Bacteroidia bacterium]|nr:hypothetical protein [Bacteroidia bacterium]
MQILLTFDYELYFGDHTGTVEKCMLGPTRMLMEMAERQGVRLCQFVDVGFLIRLEAERKRHPALEKDYLAVCDQLHLLSKNGHDLQLHIHPHWEDSYYDGTRWICVTNRYKLDDFSDAEIEEIVQRYKDKLEVFTDVGKITAFRAGGWCIQPFQRLRAPLWRAGIRIDSSVFPNGHYESELYRYDFRGVPLKGSWPFDEDPCIEKQDGPFTEIPISSIFNSPLFYWRLFLLGRLNPYRHKPLGDGIPVPAPGQRFRLLTRWTHNTVSVDGYNASLLWRALRQQIRAGHEHMVIIGHPKALSRYGLATLERFIAAVKNKHPFITFRELKTGQS